MIIADTNIWIAYLEGGSGPDVEAFEVALTDQILRMAPVVIAELPQRPGIVGRHRIATCVNSCARPSAWILAQSG